MNELARANGVRLLLCGLSQRRRDFQWVTSACTPRLFGELRGLDPPAELSDSRKGGAAACIRPGSRAPFLERSTWLTPIARSCRAAILAERENAMFGFELTEEQRELKSLAHKFAEQEIIPRAREYDEKEIFPRDVCEKAFAAGL